MKRRKVIKTLLATAVVIIALLIWPFLSSLLLVNAVNRGRIGEVKFLVSSLKVDPNTPGISGEPLYGAAGRGETFMVRELVKLGANPNLECDSYEYALDTAVSGQHLGTVKALLELGANPNCNCEGSPLDRAQGNPPMIALLKKYGAIEIPVGC